MAQPLKGFTGKGKTVHSTTIQEEGRKEETKASEEAKTETSAAEGMKTVASEEAKTETSAAEGMKTVASEEAKTEASAAEGMKTMASGEAKTGVSDTKGASDTMTGKGQFRGENRKFGFDKEKRFEITRKKNPRATIKSAQKIYKREEEITGEVRLNKFIANSGICSRREADKYIQAGVITVNGNVVSELGVKVKPTDDIRFNGERLLGEKKIYIVMNKPKDYVTTTSDPHAEKTVMDLLKGCKQRVFPVGRLDKSTTGVLLFTNDGRLADKLTHPAYNKKKIYQVTLDRKLTKPDFDKILEGIWLPDGEIHADELAYTDDTQKVVGISIHSGRNRIIRRIFESLDYKILKLDRVYFAGLTKKRLTRGEWRYLEEKEVNMLLMGAYE